MKSLRSLDFFDSYRIMVPLVGAIWRCAVAWPYFERSIWSAQIIVVGLLPYAALAKLSRVIRSRPFLLLAAVLVFAEDVRIKISVSQSHGKFSGVALYMYPLLASFVVMLVYAFVSSVNKRSDR
jgi:hypothetical protein